MRIARGAASGGFCAGRPAHIAPIQREARPVTLRSTPHSSSRGGFSCVVPGAGTLPLSPRWHSLPRRVARIATTPPARRNPPRRWRQRRSPVRQPRPSQHRRSTPRRATQQRHRRTLPPPRQRPLPSPTWRCSAPTRGRAARATVPTPTPVTRSVSPPIRSRIATGDDAGYTGSPGLNHEMTDAMEAFVAACNDLGGINGRQIATRLLRRQGVRRGAADRGRVRRGTPSSSSAKGGRSTCSRKRHGSPVACRQFRPLPPVRRSLTARTSSSVCPNPSDEATAPASTPRWLALYPDEVTAHSGPRRPFPATQEVPRPGHCRIRAVRLRVGVDDHRIQPGGRGRLDAVRQSRSSDSGARPCLLVGNLSAAACSCSPKLQSPTGSICRSSATPTSTRRCAPRPTPAGR